MKTLLVLAMVFTSASAFAVGSPNVNSARYNSATQSIEIDVSYSGGCVEQKFELRVGGCLESMPVQCSATVVDVSEKPDFCQAYLNQTISFKLSDYGLDGDYYQGASFSIRGAGDSKVYIRLP